MKSAATLTTLSGQPEQENNYEAQPVKPVVEKVKVKGKMTVELKPYSFIMYTINL